MVQTLFLINEEPPEIRIAELGDGRLLNLDVEREGRMLGNIYKGRVQNILPGMDAAFVDLGLARNGLLHASDAVRRGLSGQSSGPVTIEKLLQPNQELMVQIARPPVGHKGARLTMRILLPGRFAVLVDGSDSVGISRRIEDDDERNRLRRIAERLRPLNQGLIIRTEAENAAENELVADILQLKETLTLVKERATSAPAPALIHRDLGLVGRLVRDRLNEQTTEVWVDSPVLLEDCQALVSQRNPSLLPRLKLHEGPVPLFTSFSVEAEIQRATQRVVPLSHGGSLAIDEAEALTVIDVNTAKYIGKNRLAETALTTNLDALDEAARQLRLRDIGGIIVIDFIEMERGRDRVRVLNALEQALRADRNRTRIVQLSPSGLVELTRRREGYSLRQLLHTACPYCSGNGVVKSLHSLAIESRRRLRELARRLESHRFLVTLHPALADAFIGPDEEYLRQLEQSCNIEVALQAETSFHVEEVLIAAQQEPWPEVLERRGDELEFPTPPVFYPDPEPLFTTLEGRLVLLHEPPRPGEPTSGADEAGTAGDQKVATRFWVLDANRWFVRASIKPPV